MAVPGLPPGSPCSQSSGAAAFPGGAAVGAVLSDAPWPAAGPGGVLAVVPRPSAGLGASFPSMFGGSDMSLQEIADKAHQLQQRIDENAEQEKASLRAAAETKHLEIERHAAELARTAAQSIEAYKASQLQTAERQKAYQQALVRQQAEQAKRLVDQQAAQAIAAVEARDRQLDLQKRQQELQRNAGPPLGGYSLHGNAQPGMPVMPGMSGMHGMSGISGMSGMSAMPPMASATSQMPVGLSQHSTVPGY